VLPAVALAVSLGLPKAGHWKLDVGGGFSLNHATKSISGFRINGANCNYGMLTVRGNLPLSIATAAGVSVWIVGFNDPARKNPNDRHGVVGRRVTISSAGKTLHGRLEVIFGSTSNVRAGNGDLVIGGCDAPFFASR
jgi:hypothetical protein